MPCHPPTASPAATACAKQRSAVTPSLFCFSVMQPRGPENSLVVGQLSNNASIFACNEYTVVSPERMLLGMDECGAEVWTLVNPAPVDHLGHIGLEPGVTTNSFLNALTFIHAWNLLTAGDKLWRNDWTVKADPDAVFFPDRLRGHVRAHTGRATYLLNCYWANAAKLFGALEVFSKQAMQLYQAGQSRCRTLKWHGWGEDLYIQKCMELLGAEAFNDFDLVGDNRCKAAACTDDRVVAYHPFKDPASYWACYAQSPKASALSEYKY